MLLHPLSSRSISKLFLLFSLSLAVRNTRAAQDFNTSICSTFKFEGVYFHLNAENSGDDIEVESPEGKVTYIYNMCRKVQYYCEGLHSVVEGSLIAVFKATGSSWEWQCYAYRQSQIQQIKTGNLNSGVKVIYKILNAAKVDEGKGITSTIEVDFACLASEGRTQAAWEIAGCPHVEKSLIFDYLSRQELAFTISCEVLGVLLMVLGVYIYRVSIVLIGAFSLFTMLLFIEIPFVFDRGVSDEPLNNIIILTAVCSFFGGYVAAYFPKIGLFVLGAWMGIIISLTLNNIAFYYIPSTPANLTLWIVMPVLGVGFGIVALCVKKTFIILATSLIGAYLCLRALSWHLGAFPNEFMLARNYHLGLVGPVEWQFYLYMVALLILTASSAALQYWMFNKKSELEGNRNGIDSQFVKMEEDLIAKRGNLVEFQQIFRKKKSKGPKVLAKSKRSASEAPAQENNSEESEDESQDTEKSSHPPKRNERQESNELKKKLIKF